MRAVAEKKSEHQAKHVSIRESLMGEVADYGDGREKKISKKNKNKSNFERQKTPGNPMKAWAKGRCRYFGLFLASVWFDFLEKNRVINNGFSQ